MVPAYNGNEPYIFVSYSHQDSKKVFETIGQLTSLGYRIWYDEGIRPGVEWPENIAVHLDRCALFMMFISPNSMDSANCRREINFALTRSKPFLCIVLEETEIPLGMELQLASQQSIFRYKYTSEKEYILKICSAAGMAQCKNTHYFEENRPELARMDSDIPRQVGSYADQPQAHVSGTVGSMAGSSANQPQTHVSGTVGSMAGSSANQPQVHTSGSARNMAGSGGTFEGSGRAAKNPGKSGAGGSFGDSSSGNGTREPLNNKGRKKKKGKSNDNTVGVGIVVGLAIIFAFIMILLARTVLGGKGTDALTPTPTPAQAAEQSSEDQTSEDQTSDNAVSEDETTDNYTSEEGENDTVESTGEVDSAVDVTSGQEDEGQNDTVTAETGEEELAGQGSAQ